MSPDSPPFASASHGTFHSGIEYNLLQLISEKLKKSVRFEFLDVATNHDVLNHIIHGNLSEAFQMLVLWFLVKIKKKNYIKFNWIFSAN